MSASSKSSDADIYLQAIFNKTAMFNEGNPAVVDTEKLAPLRQRVEETVRIIANDVIKATTENIEAQVQSFDFERQVSNSNDGRIDYGIVEKIKLMSMAVAEQRKQRDALLNELRMSRMALKQEVETIDEAMRKIKQFNIKETIEDLAKLNDLLSKTNIKMIAAILGEK